MSIKWLKIPLIMAVIICLAPRVMAEKPLETKIREILEASSLVPDKTGIAVVSVNRGDELALINADFLLNPASCTKIATALAALSILGPGYQFQTAFYTDQQDLYVVGSGDPSLVSEQMLNIVYEIKNRGVKSVGDIVIDDSFFDGPWYPRKDGDDGRAFTAATSAFSLNFNSAKFVIAPGRKKAEVLTDPPTPYIHIINRVSTGGRFRVGIVERGEGDVAGETYIISGTMPGRAAPQSIYRNVREPSLYAGSVLKEMLIQNGIAVSGAVRKGKLPAGASEVMVAKSKPLSEIVKDMNKFSNNFIAEQMIKHLGAVKKGKPGSTAAGMQVISDFLASIGLPKGTYIFENGSGLSAANRITASQLAKILYTAYRNRALQPDFIESLSILGIDGTMKKWRGGPKLNGWVRAKTGSLDNVSALAGYVPMQNGEVAAFVIISNGFRRGKYSVREAELKIASEIAKGN